MTSCVVSRTSIRNIRQSSRYQIKHWQSAYVPILNVLLYYILLVINSLIECNFHTNTAWSVNSYACPGHVEVFQLYFIIKLFSLFHESTAKLLKLGNTYNMVLYDIVPMCKDNRLQHQLLWILQILNP